MKAHSQVLQSSRGAGHRRILTRLFVFPIAYAAIFAAVSSLLFLALAFFVSDFDEEWIAHRIDPHTLSEQYRPFLLRPDYPVPLWDHNECMILYMLVTQYPSRLAQTVTPLVPKPPGYACGPLAAKLNGETPTDWPYHRYLHGYRITTALMLQAVPLWLIPWVLVAIVHLLAAAVVTIAALKLRRSLDRDDRDGALVGAGYLAIGLSLLLFWGLPRWGTSISFAFGDAVVIGLPLWFLLYDPLRMSERAFLITCCSFGAATAWLEFLTGQAPLMMALIPGCLAVSSFSATDTAALQRRAIQGLLSFLATAGICFMIKWAVAAAVDPAFAQELAGAILNLTVAEPGLSLEANPKILFERLGLPTSYDGTPAHWLFWMFASFALSAPTLGFGSFFLGFAIMVVSTAIAVAGLVIGLRRAATPIDRVRIGVLIFSLGMLALWYATFHTHLLRHSSYMVRPLVWLTALAAIAWMQVWLIARRKQRPAGPV